MKGPQNRKLLQGHSLHDLPRAETTLAEHLRDAGYLTALVGKWHLGLGSFNLDRTRMNQAARCSLRA